MTTKMDPVTVAVCKDATGHFALYSLAYDFRELLAGIRDGRGQADLVFEVSAADVGPAIVAAQEEAKRRGIARVTNLTGVQ